MAPCRDAAGGERGRAPERLREALLFQPALPAARRVLAERVWPVRAGIGNVTTAAEAAEAGPGRTATATAARRRAPRSGCPDPPADPGGRPTWLGCTSDRYEGFAAAPWPGAASPARPGSRVRVPVPRRAVRVLTAPRRPPTGR